MIPALLQKKFTAAKKGFFMSHVYVPNEEQKNSFYYQNESEYPEELTTFLLTKEGEIVPGFQPEVTTVLAGLKYVFNASSFLATLGYKSFSGSVLIVVSPSDPLQGFDTNSKDLLSVWTSAKNYCQIGMALFFDVNLPEHVGKKSFFMYCPAVEVTGEKNTRVVIFNSSSHPAYNDTITVSPILANTTGEKIIGKPISISPFAIGIIDIAQYFGEEGEELLKKTKGQGTLSASHQGHIMSAMFFQIDRKTNMIISGIHTQPPIGVVYTPYVKPLWFHLLAARLPYFWIATSIKRFFTSPLWHTFYPYRPRYLPSTWDYFKQSRFVLWGVMLIRAFWFLLLKGFKFDSIKITDKNKHDRHVIAHNLWEDLAVFQLGRGRIEHLLYLLMAVPANKNGKTLFIGPKNEGELLLFRAHDFSDLTAIDLFSYSPWIKTMDVHYMTFSDNTFDTISCGWVLRYCYDLRQALKEIIRVSKNGAVIACGFSVPEKVDNHPVFVGSKLMANGISEILEILGNNVGHIYFRNDDPSKNEYRLTLVFRVSK